MIIPPHRDFPITVDGRLAEDRFLGWIQSITEAVNFAEPLNGNGSPNGTVKAPKYKRYIDIAGSPGAIEFIKTTDENLNTGWVALG